MEENPDNTTLWIIGGAVVLGAIWLMAGSKKKTAAAAPPPVTETPQGPAADPAFTDPINPVSTFNPFK